MKAVIQAGGKGTRLYPYTQVLPKPLMPIGNIPVIEILIKWLRRNDICQVYITTGYLGHLIQSLCGDGKQWDLQIEYSQETEPLGTIGPLKLLKEQLTETFLVLNGDLVTDLEIREFVAFHREKGGMVTVSGTEKKIPIDLGVIDCENGRTTNFREKPVFNFEVSMGIYCMEPEVFDLIPHSVPFGFDNLMYAMLDRNIPVNVYHHNGYWMDIGREEDFRKAQEHFSHNGHFTIGT